MCMKKAALKKKKVNQSASLQTIGAKLDRVIDAMVTREEFNVLVDRVSNIEKTLEKVLVAIDRLTKNVEDLLLEYAVIKQQLERHDRWFREIAKKVGIELKP